jgi:hypothetical protein
LWWKNEFCFIPAGYPQLDTLARQLEKAHSPQDALVYAPSLVEHRHGRTIQDGAAIIDTLLNAFPHLKIIYRPFPTDKKSAPVEYLQNQFSGRANFLFDDNPSYTESYARSLLLITDFSNTSLVYSFAALKPFIFCRLDANSPLPYNFNLVNMERAGRRAAHMAESLEQLLAVIKFCLANPQEHESLIKSLRAQIVPNFGQANKYLAKNIGYIIHNKINPAWFYFRENKRVWMVDHYLSYLQSIPLSAVELTWYAMPVVEQGLQEYPDSAELHLYKAFYLLLFKNQNYYGTSYMTAEEQASHWEAQEKMLKYHLLAAARQGKKFIISDGQFRIVPL